jgi:hypothetical protein
LLTVKTIRTTVPPSCLDHASSPSQNNGTLQDNELNSATGTITRTAAMLEYQTEGFQGYAVKYSPFFDNRIAVAAAANFGLVGNGRLFILELTTQGIRLLKW